MTFTQVFVFISLVITCVSSQSSFADYDYQDSFTPQQQPARPPPRAAPSRPQFSQSRFHQDTTTTFRPPVAILKQINRHNDDGSYTYGYEGADGSFKIETKLVTGEVMGKYGYVDEAGKLRTVEYGANRYGFQPSGDGITVPPPTLVDESTRKDANGQIVEYDDGSFYEPEPAPKPVRSRPRSQPQQPQRSQPQQQFADTYTPPVARQQKPSFGPLPPRAAVPGAAPTVRSSQRSAPVPSFDAIPAPRPAPVHEPRQLQGRLHLDELYKQYDLGQSSGRALHDISFGSYSSQTNF